METDLKEWLENLECEVSWLILEVSALFHVESCFSRSTSTTSMNTATPGSSSCRE